MALDYGTAANLTVQLAGPFSMGGGAAVKLTVITLPAASWKGAASPYAQEVAVDGISVSSMVDLQPDGALLAQLAQLWQDRAGLLEKLASHDALHDVDTAIAEAKICLECRDHDDFLRTMSAVEMGLTHLKDEEAVRWENLY
jgi:hypothetical protein